MTLARLTAPRGKMNSIGREDGEGVSTESKCKEAMAWVDSI